VLALPDRSRVRPSRRRIGEFESGQSICRVDGPDDRGKERRAFEPHCPLNGSLRRDVRTKDRFVCVRPDTFPTSSLVGGMARFSLQTCQYQLIRHIVASKPFLWAGSHRSTYHQLDVQSAISEKTCSLDARI
jgi:hypothetical protein